MSNEFMGNLPESESKALSLCGITTTRQLANIPPQDLLKELQQAHSFFPNDIPEELLSEERLAQICEGANHHVIGFPETSEEEGARLASNRISENIRVFGSQEESKDDDFVVGHVPVITGIPDAAEEQTEPVSSFGHAEAEQGKSMRFSTIRCGHPIAIYMGSIATLLLIPAFFLVVGIVVEVMGKGLSHTQLYIALAIVIAILVFYFIMNSFARCTVCHINIFSLRAYPRNKYAFRIPLLGCTFSTALRILFTMKFTCPACGTKLKLSGHNPHHRRHGAGHDLYKSRHHHH